MKISKIISGGQTGADRAGLDAAIELGLPHGGYAPKGRKAEDGTIPEMYDMTEMTFGGYPARTKKNIEESDGTLIFIDGPLKGGTKMTLDHAHSIEKPYLVVNFDKESIEDGAKKITEWATTNDIAVLNVAGPRASGRPLIHSMIKKTLLRVLKEDDGFGL